MASTKPKKVLTMHEDKNGDRHWTQIGVAFTNDDGGLNLQLNALPIERRVYIRDDKKRGDSA